MNGPDRYELAEKIMEGVRELPPSDPAALANIAAAQVHATLALAAAVAELSARKDKDSFNHWLNVLDL